MKVVVLSHLDPVVYPALRQIALALQERGANVSLVSSVSRDYASDHIGSLDYLELRRTVGLRSRIVWLRTRFDEIFSFLAKERPDIIIAQNDYISPAAMYKMIVERDCILVTHMTEYQRNRKYTRLLRHFANMIDVYVDVCDIWLDWRRSDWKKLHAEYFIIRHTPNRQESYEINARVDQPRVIFTGSKYVLKLDQQRLSAFLRVLCSRGVPVDWYLPGDDDVRSKARGLLSHPLFNVKSPIGKAQLMDTLRLYDVGLHWAPMAEKEHDPDYFYSAASNKIGEYVAGGLVVAHAGNPGLNFLPKEVCATYDATNPEEGANRLADVLNDRSEIDHRRKAALRFHYENLNFEAQAAPFVDYILRVGAERAPRGPYAS